MSLAQQHPNRRGLTQSIFKAVFLVAGIFFIIQFVRSYFSNHGASLTPIFRGQVNFWQILRQSGKEAILGALCGLIGIFLGLRLKTSDKHGSTTGEVEKEKK